MSEIKLLPCPFCGGEAILVKGWCELENFVACKMCSCKTKTYNTNKSAIKAWNTRKPMDKIVERLEQIKMRYFLTIANTGDENSDSIYEEVGNAIDKAIEIIKEEINSNLRRKRYEQ